MTGAPERLLAPGELGLSYFPDGHLSYLEVGDRRRLWLSSGLRAGSGRTVALDTEDLVAFAPAGTEGPEAAAGLEPVGDGLAFDSDYSGPGSVIPSADGSTLWMIYHGENSTFAGVRSEDGSPYYATIGLAASSDQGLTWRRNGAVVAGQVPRDDRPAPREVVGAGMPCAVVADGFVHVFFVDWNLDTPDQVHLARAPLAQIGDPGAWRKWHEGAFSAPGLGGASTAVVGCPGRVADTRFAAAPSVSWNTELECWLMVLQSADGFWWTRSADLVEWAPAASFLPLDTSPLARAEFAGYGSLLSPAAATDRETGHTAFLYLALGDSDDGHALWRVPVTVSADTA